MLLYIIFLYVQILLFKCFHIQVRIHHPKGATKNTPMAYACNWTEWNKMLKSLYGTLCKEIQDSLRIKTKQVPLYGTQNGEKEIDNTFLNLIVDVFRQIYSVPKHQFSNEGNSSEEVEPAAKRKKVEEGISSIISSIQDSKDWPWINVLTELLSRYPTVISAEDFLHLLQILSTFQSECKDSDLRKHIHNCLSTLVDVQKHLKRSEVAMANAQWSVIWDTTLR